LELFLRLFRADTEEEMEILKNLEVDEMTEMVNAYLLASNGKDGQPADMRPAVSEAKRSF
jgi:hypothetical protein